MVGLKNKAAVVHALKQYRPGRRPPIRIDRGQRHRGKVELLSPRNQEQCFVEVHQEFVDPAAGLRPRSLAKPPLKLSDGIGRQILSPQPGEVVLSSQFGHRHSSRRGTYNGSGLTVHPGGSTERTASLTLGGLVPMICHERDYLSPQSA